MMWHLARSLHKNGHEINALVGDYRQPDRQVFGGIETARLHDGPARIKGFRTMRYVLDLLRLLCQLKPDAVVHVNFGFGHGVLALFCRILRLHYVYFTASQADVDGTRYRTYPRYVAWSWCLGMKLAPIVIVQTEEHRALLRKNFGRESVVIPNGIDIELYRRVHNHGQIILWVANWREVKRPELVGDLARLLPECRFIMCGGIGDQKLYERIRPQLPNNVLVRGRICDSELFDAYQDALVLINTSDFEGIPVTFDEAWACELPVVSLNIDPDNIIARNGLGFVSRSIEQMALDIQQLLTEPNRVKEIGQRSRKFVELNHNVKRTSEQVERLLRNGIVTRKRCGDD